MAAILLSTLVFASLHLLNPEVGESGVLCGMLNYFVLGLFLCIVAVVDDGLEMAWGVHAIQNIYVVTCWNMSTTSIPSDSLFLVDEATTYGSIGKVTIAIILCLLLFSRMLKWDWRMLKLNKRIDVNQVPSDLE